MKTIPLLSPPKVGDKVLFKGYTRPYDMFSGVIVAERPVPLGEMKYEIKPDVVVGEFNGNVYRYFHARADGKQSDQMFQEQPESEG